MTLRERLETVVGAEYFDGSCIHDAGEMRERVHEAAHIALEAALKCPPECKTMGHACEHQAHVRALRDEVES